MDWCVRHHAPWSECCCGPTTLADADDTRPPELPKRCDFTVGHHDTRCVLEFGHVGDCSDGVQEAYDASRAASEKREDNIIFAALNTAGLTREPPADPIPSPYPPKDLLPEDATARKAIPVAAVLDYFDAAIVEIAIALQDGNDQHNPGEPLHWARGKSSDHDQCIIRHFLQRGSSSVSKTGRVIRHSTNLAIRALMLLQEELERDGAPMSRGSRPAKETK